MWIKNYCMPIYMDVHIVPGVKAKDVAEAHRLDILHQDEHECKCMTYWIDEQRESIFCLIEAPTKEAVAEMHSKAHGLVPNRIIEVRSELVESFLGRIYDPADATPGEDGLKVFADPSYRILLVTKVMDPVLLGHLLGSEKAIALLATHNEIIRSNVAEYGGSEVEHSGNGFIISFTSARKAVSCALAIHKAMVSPNVIGFKIAVNAGEPVENSNRLFGDTIQMAEHVCNLLKDSRVGITSAVKELVARDNFETNDKTLLSTNPNDESALQLLFRKLEENWQNPDFNVTDYCQAMTMSKSQLYRTTVELTGYSPNTLLKEFRLEKAKEMMKKKRYTISQITFDTGFTSPSYFTKCFKKKYGLLPMEYIDLLH
jgi:AraC-like DNA-binding protein